MRDLKRVVIVGAGQSALSCAKALRMQGFQGDVIMMGDERYPPYDRPPLSKGVLVGKANAESTFYLSLGELADLGIQFRANDKVTGIDRARKVVHSQSGETSYDHLVLALGARARRLTLPGAETNTILYLRSIDDCLSLRKKLRPDLRVLVLGGGLIGLEIAAAATSLGAKVVVIEAADRVMARVVDAKVSQYFEKLHRAHGVRIMTGEKPTRISDHNGDAVFVDLQDGGRIEGDLLVAGVGAEPNDDIAISAGLQSGNGIWTDEFCCTSDPAVWAIGDVANQFNPTLGQRLRLETWQNARSQGATVARNICGSKTHHTELVWGWSDQFGANLQFLGLPGPADIAILRGDIDSNSFSIFYLRNGCISGMVAVNAVADVVVSRRLMTAKSSVNEVTLMDLSVPLKSLIQFSLPR